MSAPNLEVLLRLNKPAPRYTSYPTAPQWEEIPAETYGSLLASLGTKQSPLSLYFHIPFCKTMCLYCACSVVLNRRPENEEIYTNYLCKEIDLVSSHLNWKNKVRQIHFGGGTPTQLSIPLLERIFAQINCAFDLEQAQEIAIEVDPRTVIMDKGEKLRALKAIGFNRISIGVQDTNPRVQNAVKRRQSIEMTRLTYENALGLDFKGINFDLIYGLPFQTPETFAQTILDILDMGPDRISLFSYAKVPWLKPHQQAIQEKTLPSLQDKFRMYYDARNKLVEHGYIAIGMDHFAKKNDELAKAYQQKCLQRNFQGYSLKLAEDMLGFGITSIGYTQGFYFQNLKELSLYYEALKGNKLPLHRGKKLSAEDMLRKWVIHTLMCNFCIDKLQFSEQFSKNFDDYFSEQQKSLAELEKDGLILNLPYQLKVTPLGELFIRVIAMTFDAYSHQYSSEQRYSHSV
jgi:oxygen-independent coproporphyrinogen III oxidase